MSARKFAGSMLRSVTYAANIVGEETLQFTSQQSDHARTRHLTTLIALGAPLASVSSYYHTTDTRILWAFTRHTRMREPQRFRSAIHPCWHSLTILTPAIPRPRHGGAVRRAAADAQGGRGGLQHGNAGTGRGAFQPLNEHEIADDAEHETIQEPTETTEDDFSEITPAYEGEGDGDEHQQPFELFAGSSAGRHPSGQAPYVSRTPPAAPRFATYVSVAPADMNKGLNASIRTYDGSLQEFPTFASALEFFLDSIDFILHFAQSHFGRLSAVDQNAVSAAQRQFLETYGPLGLRAAHNDCLKILMWVFDRFTLKTVETAGSFNGLNWHYLTNELKSDLQRAPATLKLRDLAALRLLDAIREYGQINPDYADLHHKVIDMRPRDLSSQGGCSP